MQDSSKNKRRSVNRRSQKQEREHAQRTGGRVQAGSGSSWRAREDVRGPLGEDGEGYLDQLKQYETGSFRITAKEWRKLRKHARQEGREPRLIIEFPREGITLVVVEGNGAD